MKSVKKSPVTYRQLDRTLRSLGFTHAASINEFGLPVVRYENAEAAAVVFLRGGSDEELVDAVDILSAERNLEGRGVIDRVRFAKALAGAAEMRVA